MLTKPIFESIMNNLKYLSNLTNLMDESLAIDFRDFISSEILKDFNIQEKEVIDVIKTSKDFHFDKKTKLIKFRKRADMNILIIKDFHINSDSIREEELIIKKIDFLKKLLLFSCNTKLSFSKNYNNFPSKLRVINFVSKTNEYHCIFENEYWTNLAFEFIHEITLNNVIFEETNLDRKSALVISVAGESLKRRLFPEMINLSIEKQKSLINQLFKDPKAQLTNLLDCSEIEMGSNLNKYKENNNNSIFERSSLNINHQYKSKSLLKRLSSVDLVSKGRSFYNNTRNKYNILDSNILNNLLGNRNLSKCDKKELEVLNGKRNTSNNKLSVIYAPFQHKNSVSLPKTNRPKLTVLDSDLLLINYKPTYKSNYKYSNIELKSVYNHLQFMNGFKEQPAVDTSFDEIFLNKPKTIEHYKTQKLKSIVFTSHKPSTSTNRESMYSNNYYSSKRSIY